MVGGGDGKDAAEDEEEGRGELHCESVCLCRRVESLVMKVVIVLRKKVAFL